MENLEKYDAIAEFGRKLTIKKEPAEVMAMIADEAKVLLDVERCSIFVVDLAANTLWTEHSDGIGRIIISLDSGIAGETYSAQTSQMVNDPYADGRFLQKIDEKSGFTTRNVLTAPIFSSKREVIGILQLLNKRGGDFDNEDLEILTFYASYVSGPLELALMR